MSNIAVGLGDTVILTEQNIVTMDACAYNPRCPGFPDEKTRQTARDNLWRAGRVVGVGEGGQIAVQFGTVRLALHISWVTVNKQEV